MITGCGVVSAAGAELEGVWSALMAGTCFIQKLRFYPPPDIPNPMGAEVEVSLDEELTDFDSDATRARAALLGLAATRRALSHAGLSGAASGGPRIGVVIGSTMGEERQIGDLSERWVSQGGEDAVDPGFFARSGNHRLATLIAQRYGMGGPVIHNATACSSGNAAIAWAYDLVASGVADIMVAGAADTLTRLVYYGFQRMGALSKSVCKPFDKNRDGVSFGEGAGIVVLESLEHARKRGAKIQAELAGYGISNDAHHITAPEPTGEGFARAMRQALVTSGTTPEQVDYVSAHGTGTQYNDLGETLALKAVLGEHAPRVAISSIKSMLGHTNGAASAIETVACTLALQKQQVPPTATLVEPDPAFGLDYVPGKGRSQRVGTCLNMSAGFGGFNVCLVLKEAP
jgi:3-oxoacyl-[acyl-carrier-protein] synthase II